MNLLRSEVALKKRNFTVIVGACLVLASGITGCDDDDDVFESPESRSQTQIAASAVLIRALNQSGRHAEAVALLERIELAYAESPALAGMRQSVEVYDAESSSTFGAVIAAWHAGREDLATGEAAFRELLDTTSGAGLVQFGMACMYFDAGQRGKAITRYRAAVRAGIERPAVFMPLSYIRIGNLLDLTGERKQAKTSYRMASKAAGEHEWVADVVKAYLKEPFDGTGGLRFP